ncbi:hypothetical protein EDF70_104462 [Neorhizobium sp. JUb45]|nr:hypothetical protein EDF70_104462 [Neorhizobium sp. JUb45]
MSPARWDAAYCHRFFESASGKKRLRDICVEKLGWLSVAPLLFYVDLMNENDKQNRAGTPVHKGAEATEEQLLKRGERSEAERKLRAAAKLRENLQRRKQQARARRAGEEDPTIGLPAAKTDESS